MKRSPASELALIENRGHPRALSRVVVYRAGAFTLAETTDHALAPALAVAAFHQASSERQT